MGYGIETIVGANTTATTVTAGSTVAYTAANSQSFNIRAYAPNSSASIEALWGYSANTAGNSLTRIRSPRLHDDVVGIESQQLATNASPMLNEYFSQTVYSQDSLTIEDYVLSAPGSAANQTVGFNVYYKDIPGINANFMTYAQVSSLTQSYYGIYTNPSTAAFSASSPSWGTGVAINSKQDVFKANSLYAILGYEVSTGCTAVSLLGVDLGNLYVGGPGSLDPKVTRFWFVEQEMANGMPSIPVINSQNKASTLVQVFGNQASATSVQVTLIAAYLGPVQ